MSTISSPTTKFERITTVEVDVAEDFETSEAKATDTKKSNKKEEDVPKLGGLKRVKKEYGSGFMIYAVVGGLAAFLNGAIMPLFAVIFAEIIKILQDSIDENGNSTFVEDSRNALLYFIGMGLGALVFNILQYYFWGIYGMSMKYHIFTNILF